MHTSFIEFGVSTISAKVGLRVGSFCHHLCSNSASIGCISAAIVSLRSCMQRYRICQIRIRNRNSTTLSEEYFTFPPSTEKIQMSYNSTFAFYLEPFPFSKLKWYDNNKMCYCSFFRQTTVTCVLNCDTFWTPVTAAWRGVMTSYGSWNKKGQLNN